MQPTPEKPAPALRPVPSRLPLHLVPKSLLQAVPESVYRPSSGAPGRQGETLRLRIGGWVNLPLGHRQPVSLLLVYRDNEGRQALLVDEMNARGASEVLLSGEVEFQAHAISEMSIYCGGISDKSVWASNLQVTRVEEQKRDAPPDARLSA